MTPLRLMTFNLRRDVPSDGADRWENRREAAGRLVAREAPHVMGTQEGLPHQLAQLDEALPHLRRVGGCRRGDGTDEHMALYYDPRRLMLSAHGDVWLSDTPDVAGSTTWGNRLPRMATWARFTDSQGGSFTAVNTHLDHESPTARERAAVFLAERFPGALIMGDFNDEPGAAVHQRFTRAGWSDTLAGHERPGDAAFTFHGFTGRARARIDWVLLPTGWRSHAHRVLVDKVDGRHVSDHHPVVVDASLRSTLPAEANTLTRKS